MLIEGYAGTGKSLTLLYKFIDIVVRENNKRILFVTYNSALIEDTKKRLNMSKEYLDNVERHEAYVMTFHQISSHILKQIKIIDRECNKLTASEIKKYEDTEYRRIASIAAEYIQKDKSKYKELPTDEKLYSTHNERFILEEIRWMKAMGFTELERYLSTERIGRSKSIRLTRNQRKTIFKIYENYQDEMDKSKYGYSSMDLEDYALKILQYNDRIDDNLKFDYVFVDEVQDLDPMQILALCKLTKGNIILSGDAKQRIYKKCPIKYEDLGLNINQKGRRKILKKNYRSTKEIVKLANSLKFYDSEGKYDIENYDKTGDKPIIKFSNDINKILDYIVKEIKQIQKDDSNKTIAIVNREEVKNNTGYKSEFRKALELKLAQSIIDVNTYSKKFAFNNKKQVFYTNVYDIKGLEFDVVFVMDFNKLYYPYKKAINQIREDNDGKDEKLLKDDILEFVNTEKKLLYVAMTRAKEKLYLIASGNFNSTVTDPIKKISDYIYDFDPKDYTHLGFKVSQINEGKALYNSQGFGSLQRARQEEKVQAEINKIIEKENIDKTVNKIDNEESTHESVENLDSQELNYSNMSKDDLVEKLIKPVLKKNKIEFIDNRAKKGALWVVGGLELRNIMKMFSQHKAIFIFKAGGGRATKGKDAWYFH